MKYAQALLLSALIGAITHINAQKIYAIFNIHAKQDANLALDSAGIVKNIFVDVSSPVKKGDVLLMLANSDKAAQLQGIKEQYIFAKKQYERYSKSADVIDKNTLEQYQTNYKKLEADYHYYQAIYEKSILRAPFQGIIAAKNIEVGEGVGGTSTIAFRLVSTAKKMLLQFDAKYQNLVRIGDVYEYILNGDTNKQRATISNIYPIIDTATRKITAEAIVDNAMMPGLSGDGFIITR